MCGIVGFAGAPSSLPDAKVRLERMAKAIGHRGPDGLNYWLSNEAGFGHARLAIIDLARGIQPMWDASERSVIVFNGEIYNHQELRRELEIGGYTFRTRCDTEVIPAAIDAWGVEGGLQRLRGMFAFALYEPASRRLILARDRVGIKPLYWASVSGGILFASEQKALLTSGLVSRRLNPVALHDYLAQGYPTTPATCWEGIQLLEPATWLELTRSGIRKGTYWRWLPREDSSLEIEAATEIMRESLTDTLRWHLLSDVPVGAFLSGGLDSSLMVALLNGHAQGLQTFNMGFGDARYDESQYARRVAQHCATDHHEVLMENNQAEPELFCRILEQYDEPFGDSSCIPTYLICREIRKHVKVALSGDGGDEVFGGYVRYLRARWLSRLSRLSRAGSSLNGLFRVAGRRLGSTGYRVAKAWRFAGMPRKEMLFALNVYFSEDERIACYQPDFATVAVADGPTSVRFGDLVNDDLGDPVQQMIAAEMQIRLHADYLRKVDIASSAHGLEVRVPYLDNVMLDLAARLPIRLKIASNGETKVVSRHLAKRLLPAEFATRPKQGFGLPLDSWMGPKMRQFLRELLLSDSAGIRSLLQPHVIESTVRDFEGDTAAGGLSRYQRYQRVFLLASLEVWLSKWKPSLP